MESKTDLGSRGLMLLGVALFSWAAPAFAQGPGWTMPSTVVSIVDVSNGGINVRLSPDLTGCTSQSGYGSSYASIYPDHPALNRMKASLLAAQASGATVHLYLGDSTCRVSEMRIGS